MRITLLGISMLSMLSQPKNAQLPMLTTLLGMNVFIQPAINVLLLVTIMALQLFLLS